MGSRVSAADVAHGVLVRIPPALRTFTDGKDEVYLEANDVESLLVGMEKAFHGIRDRIVDETGRLRPYVNVFVNDDLRRDMPREIALRGGDVVHILPSVAGGFDG